MKVVHNLCVSKLVVFIFILMNSKKKLCLVYFVHFTLISSIFTEVRGKKLPSNYMKPNMDKSKTL